MIIPWTLVIFVVVGCLNHRPRRRHTWRMGTTLSDPDFVTARGPLVTSTVPKTVGTPVRFSMGQEINEHYPTDGSPRTFYTICIVKAEEKNNFVKSILADVYEDTLNQSSTDKLTMSPLGTAGASLIQFWRNPLVRLNPQIHPEHSRAFAVDAVVLGGKGSSAKNSAGWLTFRQATGMTDEDLERTFIDGYMNVGVTWRDLPYDVIIRSAGGEDASHDTANAAIGSEILRYCIIKPQPKGQNVGITGGKMYFVDNDGSIIKRGTPPVPVIAPPEAQTYFVPMTTFNIIWKMIPRVPWAAEGLRGFVNDQNNIAVPSEILKHVPDTGTLRYLGWELSDPYYTVSETKVFDLTYSIGYRPGGNTPPYLGWNSTYCGEKREFRRIVFGEYFASGPERIEMPAGFSLVLPVSTDAVADQYQRVTDYHACIAPFANLQNLFRFEGERITE